MSFSGILSVVLMVLIGVIIVLALMYLSATMKEKSGSSKSGKQNDPKNPNNGENKGADVVSKSFKEYTVQSIFDFMEFEKVEDNMIVQKNGKRFLMIIECQGINYDLMSEVEKNSVEVGFMKVLNTLREPIQLYIQTRTINLENSIQKYRERLSTLYDEITSNKAKYRRMVDSGEFLQEEIQRQRLEVIKLENLYNYGKDIVANTERMSLNKNILRKKYYIVTSYYANSIDNEYLGQEEIKEAAFSELYTRCQSIIRALGSAEVSGKVLDSAEVVDVLYNAYNRDEAEIFGINKSENVNYDELYITAEDVLEKKMRAIDSKIQSSALNKAEEAILFANNKLKKQIEESEENMDELIDELAEAFIDDNAEYFDKETIKEAKKHIKEESTNEKNAKTKRKVSTK